MTVLHICVQQPGMDSGGGLGVYQTLRSLKMNNYEVDYVGPEIKDNDVSSLYSNVTYLKPNKNIFLRAFDVMCGRTNSRYRDWQHLKIDFSRYDIAVVDFTKLDYVVERIKDIPIIVKAHNVEFDYSRTDYEHNRTIKKGILCLLSYKQEKRILDNADIIMALSNHDINRFEELYHIGRSRFVINGVCVDKHKYKHTYASLNILITGSLWYGSNEEGIVWFLQEVYSKIDGNDIFLCIAGRNPSDRLKNICAQFNSVFLTDSPVDMKPLFEKANLYIAPIFDGAGMKVKIAEAMSYGLPVIGTDYAFVGYEIDNEKNAFLANTPEEFLQRIAFFRSIDSKKFVEYSEKAYQLYKNKYSMEASAIQWKTTIEKILEVTNDYY